MALSDGAQEDSTAPGSSEADGTDSTLTLARFYDHYELCLHPDGSPWELGRGAMGITYRAKDRNLGSLVALKVINTDHVYSLRGQERLRQEARAAAGLRHPNIASIYHLGTREDQYFYAMEYIEGETLDAYVQRCGPLPCATALLIVQQAARALVKAHESRFIHRDIKPSNLMLTQSEPRFGPESVVKLIDFGLVRTEQDADDNVMCQAYFAGTPHYASPEQLQCGAVDLRSDIYSLGLCLWYMLTGTPPSFHLNADQFGVHPTTKLPWDKAAKETIPSSVALLLQSMVAILPQARPQTAIELLRRIESCQADFSHPSQSSILRHPRRWLIFAGAVLLALAVVGVGFARYPWKNSVALGSSGGITSEHLARVFYEQAETARKKHTKSDNLRAIALYKSAVARSPDFGDAYAGLAIAYLQSVVRYGASADNVDLAIGSAQQATACSTSSPKGFHAQAMICTYQGNPWEAVNLLRKALAADPNYLPAMRDFGLLWCYVGCPHLGYAWAKATAERDPTGVVGWLAAGDASADLCADEQALVCYREMLKINPASVEAHCGLMHVHLLQSDWEQVKRDYTLVRAVDDESIFPLNLKAQLEFFTGDFQAAEEDYRSLLAKDRDGAVGFYGSISYLSALGCLRARAGATAEAKSLLEEAARTHIKESNGPQAIYDLAAIRSVQGKSADALALLQQAIAAGWMDYRVTRLDPRFEYLRHETEFDHILASLKDRVDQLRAETSPASLPALRLASLAPEAPR